MNDIIKDIENKDNLPVVSYSKITTYKNCPKSYKFAYIDKLPRVDKTYTVFGQFCHSILEKFHKEYLAGSKETNQIVMSKCFIEAKNEWIAKLTNDQIKEAYGIMQNYLDDLVFREFPNVLHVEKKIFAPIDDQLILYGFIDRIQKDNDNLFHVADYKTTKDAKYLADRTQLLLYSYTLYLENKDITKVRTSYILLKHKMKTLVEVHGIDELIEAKDKLLHTWNTIKDDKLFRPTPIFWKCKNCDYISQCKEGQGLNTNNNTTFGKVDW